MQDYQHVSFFLGHHRGAAARALLTECGLLEIALAYRANRHAWMGDLHTGVHIRLRVEDERLHALLERLRSANVHTLTRLDREHTERELDSAEWLVTRVATAGLLGGVDYGQAYDFATACSQCGAGAHPIGPLIADLGSMGKKDLDHLIYEGHWIATARVASGLRHLTGFEWSAVKSRRRPSDARFAWLRIESSLPPLHPSSTGYAIDTACDACGRCGHCCDAREPEVPTYAAVPRDARDFNVMFEQLGDWRQVRHAAQVRPIGACRSFVVSQRARQALRALGVRRLVWTPVTVLG